MDDMRHRVAVQQLLSALRDMHRCGAPIPWDLVEPARARAEELGIAFPAQDG